MELRNIKIMDKIIGRMIFILLVVAVVLVVIYEIGNEENSLMLRYMVFVSIPLFILYSIGEYIRRRIYPRYGIELVSRKLW